MSVLPLISTHLCDHSLVSLQILTAYLLEPCDDPTQSQSLLFLFMLQMSARNSGLQVSQVPTTIQNINLFALWMEA